jgi:hypothetical protein
VQTLLLTATTVSFAGTLDSTTSARDLTFGASTGTATFTGAVGSTLALGTITNVASQQLTFSDGVVSYNNC